MGCPFHEETRRRERHRVPICRWSPAGMAAKASPDGVRRSGQLQVAGRNLALARVILEVEADLLALVQRTDRRAGPLERADVDEHVRAARIGLDEAEALGCVEPLHGAGSHCRYSIISYSAPRPSWNGTRSYARL